jgi:hypothetical protein
MSPIGRNETEAEGLLTATSGQVRKAPARSSRCGWQSPVSGRALVLLAHSATRGNRERRGAAVGT